MIKIIRGTNSKILRKNVGECVETHSELFVLSSSRGSGWKRPGVCSAGESRQISFTSLLKETKPDDVNGRCAAVDE